MGVASYGVRQLEFCQRWLGWERSCLYFASRCVWRRGSLSASAEVIRVRTSLLTSSTIPVILECYAVSCKFEQVWRIKMTLTLREVKWSRTRSLLRHWTSSQGTRDGRISSLNYGDQSNSCSIVSSIEFDKDGEMFAVGGVTKKIKVLSLSLSHSHSLYHLSIYLYICLSLSLSQIYSFANIMQSAGFHCHFPVGEMTCQDKLR